MKKIFQILSILVISSTSLMGQGISLSDSLEIVDASNTLFKAIENNDQETLNKISANKIYCIICFNSTDFSDSPYMLDKDDFLENYLWTIKNSDSFQRVTKSNELRFIYEDDHRTDITILYTIYKQDELASGHEGGQFGIYFKKIDGEFKFSGMEMIP